MYVYLDTTNTDHDNVRHTVHDGVRDELVEELRDRVRYLEEDSRRKDSIILTMAQRIPELEAPPAAPGEPQAASKEPSRGEAPENDPPASEGRTEPRSWWRRFFGLD